MSMGSTSITDRVLVYHIGWISELDSLKVRLILNQLFGTEINVPDPVTPEEHWDRDILIAEINYRYEEYKSRFQDAILWLDEMEADFRFVEIHYQDGFLILEEYSRP